MGSLLGTAVRVHGGIDRWQGISLIQATVVAHRPHGRVERFALQASTRLPLLCLEHQVPGGLISSFRDGLLVVHEPDGRRIAVDQHARSSQGGNDGWDIFGASGVLWLALNAPFVFATGGFVPLAQPLVHAGRQRLHIGPPTSLGGRMRPILAAFTNHGVLRAVHQRLSGGLPGVATVLNSRYALRGGLLVATRQRLRMTGLAHATAPSLTIDGVVHS